MSHPTPYLTVGKMASNRGRSGSQRARQTRVAAAPYPMLQYAQQDSSGSTGDGSSSYAMVPSQSSMQGPAATPPTSVGVVAAGPPSSTGSVSLTSAPSLQLHRHEYRAVHESNEENTAYNVQYNQANVDASQTLNQNSFVLY